MFEVRGYGIFARLLAKENLSVIVDPSAPTAAFDFENRMLILPEWKNVPEEAGRMMISHEASHALNTPQDKWQTAIENKNKSILYKNVLNVVEDARIERLIMRKYPGLTSDYIKGYDYLVNGIKLFDLEKHPIDKMGLVDKINTHFKLNVSGEMDIDLNFDKKDEHWIDEIENAENFDDIVDIANRLFDEIPEDEKIETPMTFVIGEPSKNKNKNQSEKSNGKPVKVDADSVVMLPSEVFEKIKDTLEKYSNSKELQQNSRSDTTFKLPTVDLSKILKKFRNMYDREDNSFSKNIPTINFMYTEFERYKNALNFSNTKHLNSGNLNTRILQEFKFNENLFQKLTIRDKQKNHGIIMLLDGSGSMSDCFTEVIQQAYNMSLFADKCKIPYQMFIFSSYGDSNPGIQGQASYSLYEFFNNRDNSEMKRKKINGAKNLDLGGTPMCSSMLALPQIIEEFQGIYKTDVLNLMIISDGGCDSNGLTYPYYSYKNSLVKTSKSFMGYNDSSAAILKILKDNYNVKVMTFDLQNSYEYVMKENVGESDRHFVVPKNMLQVSNSAESRIFLKELIKFMA